MRILQKYVNIGLKGKLFGAKTFENHEDISKYTFSMIFLKYHHRNINIHKCIYL